MKARSTLKIFTFSLVIAFALFQCTENRLGVFDQSLDIGDPALQGCSSFDNKENKYTLTGAGYNIWFDRDEFHYLFKEMEGDFKLKTQLGFYGEGKDPHRKVGIMVRDGTADDAPHITATLHGDGLTVLQWRAAKGKEMRDPEDEIFAAESDYAVLELERTGNGFIMRGALEPNGELKILGTQNFQDFPKKALVGIFICSHDPDTLEQGWFSDLDLTE
jgi:hypothetical protein